MAGLVLRDDRCRAGMVAPFIVPLKEKGRAAVPRAHQTVKGGGRALCARRSPQLRTSGVSYALALLLQSFTHFLSAGMLCSEIDVSKSRGATVGAVLLGQS